MKAIDILSDKIYRKFIKSKLDGYDIVVKINSLLDLNKGGWPISYPQIEEYKQMRENPKFYEKLSNYLLSPNVKDVDAAEIEMKSSIKGEDKKRAVVSVLGLYNRGKSYVLARIFGLNLLSSYFGHTEGISILLSRADISEVLIGLDTKGSQKPVSNCDENKIKDSEATERFLQTLSLSLSDAVLIVVDRLTRDDQLYIKQVKQIFPNKENIIIVHNLSHVKTKEDLDKVIKEEIQDCFQCKKHEIKGQSPYWTSLIDGTRHVVLAHDENDSDSKIPPDAGKLVNQPTIDLLNHWLTATASVSCNRFNLVENITKFTNHTVSNYLDRKVEVSLNHDQSCISVVPPIQEDELKYADIRFNMVGLITEKPNTSFAKVEENQNNYFISLECSGYEVDDLNFNIEIINSTKKITIKSNSTRRLESRGTIDNVIIDNFKTSSVPLEWSFEFPTLIIENDAGDIPEKNYALINGILYLTLTKKRTLGVSKLTKKIN